MHYTRHQSPSSEAKQQSNKILWQYTSLIFAQFRVTISQNPRVKM